MKEKLEKELKSKNFWYHYDLIFLILDILVLSFNIVLCCVNWTKYNTSETDILFTRGILIGLLFMAILYFLKEVIEQHRQVRNLKEILECIKEDGDVNLHVDEEDVINGCAGKFTIERKEADTDTAM